MMQRLQIRGQKTIKKNFHCDKTENESAFQRFYFTVIVWSSRVLQFEGVTHILLFHEQSSRFQLCPEEQDI